ncbi:MAG: methylmalonyl Co-A mutase-associated GTPase MeaB [Desulfobacteraceae bacterium]|nr:methylmalonyl Co-A mutase-associated GTPase MeaB [Desulfobacteraceae bacterium]
MKPDKPKRYIDGVLARERAIIAKAITLIESIHPAHHQLAMQVLDNLMPYTGKAPRVGITGVPGAGKSTFIESFGMYLISQGIKVAVLAVDPSSSRSGGSILGDKTRMERLSVNPNAFIRPSPSGGTLGGVARRTRESMLVCEAAGYDVILVETVGVGQSETAVYSMVDFFLVLMLAGAGDELQGIKKGILEIADAIAINKTDGDNIERAQKAQQQYQNALHLLQPVSPNWTPPVLTCSALESEGLDTIWQVIMDHREKLGASGEIEKKRRKQALDWTWSLVEDGLKDQFFQNKGVREILPDLMKKVEDGCMVATKAAEIMLAAQTKPCR